jgi:pilus assembly protein Flp/PilA
VITQPGRLLVAPDPFAESAAASRVIAASSKRQTHREVGAQSHGSAPSANDGWRIARVAERTCVMRSFVHRTIDFLRREDGPTAVEYAVMLALIIVVCITAITTLGTNANATFTTVGNAINAAGS